jgi:hypothetical protein
MGKLILEAALFLRNCGRLGIVYLNLQIRVLLCAFIIQPIIYRITLNR